MAAVARGSMVAAGLPGGREIPSLRRRRLALAAAADAWRWRRGG